MLTRLALAVTAMFAVLVAAAPLAHALGAGGIKGDRESQLQFPDSLSEDGRILAFNSVATNLSPDSPTGSGVFARDLETGFTELISRASGVDGARANSNSGDQVISGNGRYVAFNTGASNFDPADTVAHTADVYVRDREASTTTLASRANGAAGAVGNRYSYPVSISHDGRFVAFLSSATNLDPADPDTNDDVYVRDMQSQTTILVSRATGAAGAKANGICLRASISNDGRYVLFGCVGTNLTPEDTTADSDVFLRDLQANTTVLAGRASGPAGAKPSGGAEMGSLSGDGRFAAFHTPSSLHPDDTNNGFDVYVRDLQTDTTILASRASGAAGAVAGGITINPSISDDGRRVSFMSTATNLSPDDTDANQDAYVRDIQVDFTTLISRRSGVAGTKQNNHIGQQVPISGDGRYAAFPTSATNLDPVDTDAVPDIYIRDMQSTQTSLESRATPGYPRPKAATPDNFPLVVAYESCITPNRVHASPLAFNSCNPAVRTSDHLTAGTPDANGQAANFVGSARYVALTGNPSTQADEADVNIAVSLTDIRRQGSLADYTGELLLKTSLSITDRRSGTTESEPGTGDTSIDVAVPCVATASTSVGSTCSIATTADTVLPGAVKEGIRSIWALDHVRVFDGGSDGLASTPGNGLFATQGVFIP